MWSCISYCIVCIEWWWIEYGVKDGEDGEGDYEVDFVKFDVKGLIGVMEVVEGFFKCVKSCWFVVKVVEIKWVFDVI